MGTYLPLILAFMFGLYAQAKLTSTYSKTSRILSSNLITGRQAAVLILQNSGIYNVSIEMTKGNLTDHYDQNAKVIRLSESVYNVPSIAAVGIAAHECGHAIQHHEEYFPLKIRNAIIPLTNLGSKLAMPLIFIGIFFERANLIHLGIMGYSIIAIFQLLTLPVEFNASKRALNIIDKINILPGQEYEGAKETLTAASLTYVAALVSSVAHIFYLTNIFGDRRKK